MDGTAVKEIAVLEAKGQTVEIDGVVHTRANYTPVVFDPRPEPIMASTLTGLLDYIRENRDGIKYEDLMIHVVDFSRVELFSKPTGKMQKRTVHFISELDQNYPHFPFDQFLDQESFLIKMNALFSFSEDRARVITIASKVAAQEKITGEDDGLAQNVNIQRGASGAVTDEITTRGLYTLAPYRTFRDIPQPTSAFILRLRENNGGIPRIALFDAEGEIWRKAAVDAIKNYLIAHLLMDDGKTEIKIPVIA